MAASPSLFPCSHLLQGGIRRVSALALASLFLVWLHLGTAGASRIVAGSTHDIAMSGLAAGDTVLFRKDSCGAVTGTGATGTHSAAATASGSGLAAVSLHASLVRTALIVAVRLRLPPLCAGAWAIQHM